MTQPLGNCPGCGADEPFEQVHPGECPDTGAECPEWACVACGTGVVMGTVVMSSAVMSSAVMGSVIAGSAADEVCASPSVRAA